MNPHAPHLCRRSFLKQAWNGFGMLPFAHLLWQQSAKDSARMPSSGPDGSRAAIVRHHAPRIRSVIFLYMDGGPSQVDTFDYKPILQRDNGKPFPLPMSPTQFNNNGNTLGSPWQFRQHGNSGLWISDLLPNIARQAEIGRAHV